MLSSYTQWCSCLYCKQIFPNIPFFVKLKRFISFLATYLSKRSREDHKRISSWRDAKKNLQGVNDQEWLWTTSRCVIPLEVEVNLTCTRASADFQSRTRTFWCLLTLNLIGTTRAWASDMVTDSLMSYSDICHRNKTSLLELRGVGL